MSDLEKRAIKAWLGRYRQALEGTEALENRIEARRARLESARTSHLDGMPHGGGYSSDSIGAGLAALEQLEARAAEQRAEARRLYAEIDDAISQIQGRDSGRLQTVLSMRYLDCERWAVISECLFGNLEGFEDHEESFLRRTTKTANRGYEQLLDLIPAETLGEIMEEQK